MASDLLKVADSPNIIGIDISNGKVDDIEKMAGVAPPLSLKCPLYCCLPPELLAAIFLEYARYSDSFVYSTRVPPWVTVSYVCRYWRDVALQCANLWARLFFVSSEWVDELLRRSKNAPLIVRVNFNVHSGSKLGLIRSLEKALGNIERIQELWVDFSMDVTHIILAQLDTTTPLLHLLCLPPWTTRDHQSHLMINRDTLPGAMLGLRKVHLQFCHVNWSSPIFNGLTELTLCYLFNNPVECWDGLLLTLRQLPCLRQLYLDHIVPPVDMGDLFINSENIAKSILFHHLEMLTLIVPIPWAMALLARLKFPRSTIVRLECDCDDPQVIPSLLPLTLGCYSSTTTTAQTPSGYLDFRRSEHSWKLKCGASTLADAPMTKVFRLNRQDLGFEIVLNTFLQFGSDDILRWFRALPVAQLNAITLHDDICGDFDHEYLWAELFRGASELHTIEVKVGCFQNLLRALRPHDDVKPAPTLTNIMLALIDFKPEHCFGWQGHSSSTECVRCLFNILSSRAEAGMMLQRLVLEHCTNVTKDDVAELSKVVGRIEWTPEEPMDGIAE